MRIVDANILLYAVDESAARHPDAHAWLDRVLGENEPVGFAWLVLAAFVRLSTHASISANPFAVGESIDIVEAWLAQPVAVVVEPGRDHLQLLRHMLSATGTGGNLVNDAHLAALAASHNATVVTYDNDFGRFPGVSWQPPS